MKFIKILRFILNHPSNTGSRFDAVVKFLRWQIGIRILNMPVIIPWVNNTHLIAHKGLTSVTGNIYGGLTEFNEMAFLLHYLRPEDIFFDIGANVGTYTILAGKVVGSQCLAVEPIPKSYCKLMDNIFLNRIQDRVTSLNIGLGRSKEKLCFSTDWDTENRVLNKDEINGNHVEVEVRPLDDICEQRRPTMIKIDVEGFESEIVAGGVETFACPELNVVFMELRGHGKRYGFDEIVLDKHMREIGFSAWIYDPLHRIIKPKPLDNGLLGDMLYIRDIDSANKRIADAKKYKINKIWI
jgi:FkbM family methyltransferase